MSWISAYILRDEFEGIDHFNAHCVVQRSQGAPVRVKRRLTMKQLVQDYSKGPKVNAATKV